MYKIVHKHGDKRKMMAIENKGHDMGFLKKFMMAKYF